LLVSTIFFRIMLAALFVVYIISHYFRARIGLSIGIALVALIIMSLSRPLKRRSILIERIFVRNFRRRDIRDEYLGRKKPAYAENLLTRDLHLTHFVLPNESLWAGKTLQELCISKKYGVYIVSIIRGNCRINIPGGSERLFPNDRMQIIGTDEELKRLEEDINNRVCVFDESMLSKGEMILRQFVIDTESVFVDKSIKESGIRDKYRCLIAGLDRKGESIVLVNANERLQKDDTVWVVGEHDDVYRLIQSEQ
jgi:K+ transport systems, NAD-binding component